MSTPAKPTPMQNFKSKSADSYLYFTIAFLPVLVGWPEPLSWRAWLSALLAGLTALKAKRSTGDDSEGEPQPVEVVNEPLQVVAGPVPPTP